MISEIFSEDFLFLFFIVFIWIIAAIIQDFRKREVANWWNFSFIAIILAYRAFLSVSLEDYRYFLWGLIGLIAGFIIANLFYYMRLFAGGDAKFLIGFLCFLPINFDWQSNLIILIWFLVLFLLFGGIYGGIYSAILCLCKFREFSKQFNSIFKEYKKGIFLILFLGLLFIVFGIFSANFSFVWIGVLIFISPILIIYAKSIEEACMTKLVNVKFLTIGDLLVKDIKIGKRIIKPNWQGVSEAELKLIQEKYKRKILVRYGIPFTPAFLFALLALIIIFWKNFNILINF